jgi:hypothetical protein
MINFADLMGRTRPATPGSNTPVTDLEPSFPTAIPNTYTPDQEYSHIANKPQVGKTAKKWFAIWDIGSVARSGGSNSYQITSPLTIAAGRQTIEFQDPPDKVYIGILANNGANAELDVWLGDGGGPPIRLGNGGFAKFPLQGESRVSFQAFGQSIKGTLLAVSGYDDSDIAFDPASQP